MESVHSLEDAVEVGLLVWEELGEGFLASLDCVGEYHLTHGDDLLVVEEHVLCTCESDTLGSEGACYLCVVWCVGVGAHLKLGVFVAEVHEGLEVA